MARKLRIAKNAAGNFRCGHEKGQRQIGQNPSLARVIQSAKRATQSENACVWFLRGAGRLDRSTMTRSVDNNVIVSAHLAVRTGTAKFERIAVLCVLVGVRPRVDGDVFDNRRGPLGFLSGVTWAVTQFVQ